MSTLIIRSLGHQNYTDIWQAMRRFTEQRTANSPDECWLVEHFPVFTQGQNGKPEHILNPAHIPIVQSDRGGQVTYHGPGQLMVYTLLDLNRKKLSIRDLVSHLEKIIITFLAAKNITAYAKREAPGVYIEEKKICSIGLRVKCGCSYHGLAFNVDMDLSPFLRINPCGYSTLSMTQLSAWTETLSPMLVGQQLIEYLAQEFGYTSRQFLTELI